LTETWGYKFRVRKEDGTWGWKTKKGFETRREAQAAQRAALIASGLCVESAPEPPRLAPMFQQVLDQFLNEAECTLGTVEAYRKQSRYPSRELGHRPIDLIKTEDLKKLFNHLRLVGGDRGRPLSPKTLKHIRFLVKCVFDLAVKEKHIVASPLTKDLRTPKVTKKRFKMIEKDQLKDVIAKARGRRIYPILEVTGATGARMGEILALQWPDYNAERGKLEISKALEDTRFGVRVKGTKTEETRIISLPPSILAVLEEHRRNQEHDRAVMGPAYNDQGYIFAPPQGGFYRPSNMSTRVSAFFRKHGFALSMHKLRHAHASLLLSEGAPVTAVADRLGHAKPATTLDLYSHVIPSDRDRLALMWDNAAAKPRVVEMFPRVPLKRKKRA
jgi:integrase